MTDLREKIAKTIYDWSGAVIKWRNQPDRVKAHYYRGADAILPLLLSAKEEMREREGVSLHSQGRAGSPSDRSPEGGGCPSACSSLTQGGAE